MNKKKEGENVNGRKEGRMEGRKGNRKGERETGREETNQSVLAKRRPIYYAGG